MKIPLIYQKILDVVRERNTAKINVVFYKYSWESKMKIIPMRRYIILENYTSQILCILYVKKIIIFHSCTMSLETENIKYKEEGEIFQKHVLRKSNFPHYDCL